MNYLATLTRPMGQRYGAERPVIVPDNKGFDTVVRLKMPDGSTPLVRVLDPEEKNAVQVRLLVPVTEKRQPAPERGAGVMRVYWEPTPESREITVTRAYWNANAKSILLEDMFGGWELVGYAALSSLLGAAAGSFLPSYGAARGAGVGLAFMVGHTAGKAAMTKGDARARTVGMRVGSLVGGAAAAAGTAALVKRR